MSNEFVGDEKKYLQLLELYKKHIQNLKNKSSIRIKSMDHDFLVGPQHKLIPSVYGIREVNKNGNVSYSGDTFIRIRSGKHNTSNAFTHAFDVRELFETKLVRRRPIMLKETVGAKDEAPRFPKTLATAIDLFRLLDLDVLLHGVNAAGL